MVLNMSFFVMNRYMRAYNSHEAAVSLQRCWRTHRCRKKIHFFSKLPSDLWTMIRIYIRTPRILFAQIDHLINIRLVRYFWTPIQFDFIGKMRTLRLVNKYIYFLTHETQSNAFRFCIRLLNHNRFSMLSIQMMINSTIETILKSSNCHNYDVSSFD